MKLDELIAQFRVDAMDREEPYLWGDDDVKVWLDEAQAEAAIRGRLLHESADPAVCQIQIEAGRAVYPLHPALYEITHIGFLADGASKRHPLDLSSPETLDSLWPDWRDRTGAPEMALQGDSTLRLVPTPCAAGTLKLEGYRLPLKKLANETDRPEINAAHHRHLVHWVLHRAFSIPDAETLDKERAATAEAAFTAYFGERPDSDLRRSTRTDVPQHNVAHWA